MTPISFNEKGTEAFNEFCRTHAAAEVIELTAMTYFNKIEKFYNNDEDIVTHVELSRHESKDNQPHIFEVTRDMVEWIDED